LLILPLAWVAATVSRRTSSAVICLLLAVSVLVVPLTPLLDDFLPTWKWRVPALEATGAFNDEVPDFLEYENKYPLPGQPEEMRYEETSKTPTAAIVLVLWVLGAIGFLAVRLWGSLNVKLRYAKSRPLQADHPSVQIMQIVAMDMGMKYTPWLLENPSIRGAQTSGAVRPSILIPTHFESMDHDQQAMILRHELAHIQRRDVLARTLLEAIAVIFWFHPLVWLVLKRYDQETEKACDDAVLHGGYPAPSYSETLLGTARSSTSTGDATAVRQRITSILRNGKHRHPLRLKTALGFVALLFLVILPLSLITFTPYPAVATFQPLPPDGSLRALWKMNLNRGSIVPDWSGHERHGKIFGAKWVTDAERGPCLSFDGKDDHLVLRAPEADWTDKPFTVCIWLKPAEDADGGGLLLKGDLNKIWSSAQGNTESPTGGEISFSERQISLSGGDGAGGAAEMRTLQPGMHPTLNYYNLMFHRSSRALSEGKWTHLAIVSSPDKARKTIVTRFYCNGKFVVGLPLYTGNPEKTMDWPTQLWYFARGESPRSKDNHYEGLASDLAIYQKALSAEEVKKVMQGEFTHED